MVHRDGARISLTARVEFGYKRRPWASFFPLPIRRRKPSDPSVRAEGDLLWRVCRTGQGRRVLSVRTGSRPPRFGSAPPEHRTGDGWWCASPSGRGRRWRKMRENAAPVTVCFYLPSGPERADIELDPGHHERHCSQIVARCVNGLGVMNKVGITSSISSLLLLWLHVVRVTSSLR